MKKITIIYFMALCSIGYAQNGPINFETSGNGATWTWNTFENGTPPAALEIIANPFPSGINTSATVAKLTPLIIGEPWAGVENIHPASNPTGASPFGSYTITASNCTVKIMVYKSVISDVGIKFATATNGSTGQIKVPNTLINQWEELTFDFSGKIGETNDQIIIFPDFQTRTTNNVCYFDNITFGSQVIKPEFPLDFESTVVYYNFLNSNSAVGTKLANPDSSGINTSANVGKITKNIPGVAWACSYLELGSAIDFSTINSIKMKVWSPIAGVVMKLKLENLTNPAFNVEVDVTNTVANAWEELTFTFPGIVNANSYKRVVFFFNFNNNGAGESYYFDDVKLNTNLSLQNFLNDKINIFPNPANDLITISSDNLIEAISLYNVLGQEVISSRPNNNNQTIDIASLNSGVYIIKTTIAGATSSSRIVKK